MAQHASTAVALAALAMMAPALVPGTASAQQVAANATPTIENAGQIAAELCARRGDHGADCIRNERNRMVQDIGDRARATSAAARQQSAAARQESEDLARAQACLNRLIEGNRDGTLPKAVVVTTPSVVNNGGRVSKEIACTAETEARNLLKQRAAAPSAQPISLRQ